MTRIAFHREDFADLLAEFRTADDLADLVERRARAGVPLTGDDDREVKRRMREIHQGGGR